MDDADELLMLYDGPTTVLEGRDLSSIAKYMKSPQCKRVFVMVGTSAGLLLRAAEVSRSSARVRHCGSSTAGGERANGRQ